MNRNNPIGRAYVVGVGGEVVLDNMNMRNVVFQNAHIKYSGGPVKMSNIYFVNCTFDLPKNEQGEQFALSILDSPAISFSRS
jgi:hypothetical protein